MTASTDISKRRENIQWMIANDNIEQAIKQMFDFLRDFSDDKDSLRELIVLSSSYNRLEKIERRRELSFTEIEQRRNQLLFQALELMDSVQLNIGLTVAMS